MQFQEKQKMALGMCAIFSAILAVVIASCVKSCQMMKDNPLLAEVVEELIEIETGLDIDLDHSDQK